MSLLDNPLWIWSFIFSTLSLVISLALFGFVYLVKWSADDRIS